MFYSETLLSKTGPLARVWLSANLERKLSKTHILQSNIETSVGAIVGQDQAPMALRLSGQLLLGVVRIYSRKARYLLEDCNEALMKIKMAFRPGNVDLPAGAISHSTAQLTLPDVITELDLLLPDPTLDLGGLGDLGDILPLQAGHQRRNADITLDADSFVGSMEQPRAYYDRDDDLQLEDEILDIDIGEDRDMAVGGGLGDLITGSDSMEIGRDAPLGRDIADDLFDESRMSLDLGLDMAKARESLPPPGLGFEDDLDLGLDDDNMGFGRGMDIDFDGDTTIPAREATTAAAAPATPAPEAATEAAQAPEAAVDAAQAPEAAAEAAGAAASVPEPLAARERSESPLSSVRSSVGRQLSADFEQLPGEPGDNTFQPNEDEDSMRLPSEDIETAHANQQASRKRKVLVDPATEIKAKVIKAQQTDRARILQQPSFLPRDPAVLALMSLTRNGGLAHSMFYPKNMAPELSRLLAPDFVKRMADLKRKRVAGGAQGREDEGEAQEEEEGEDEEEATRPSPPKQARLEIVGDEEDRGRLRLRHRGQEADEDEDEGEDEDEEGRGKERREGRARREGEEDGEEEGHAQVEQQGAGEEILEFPAAEAMAAPGDETDYTLLPPQVREGSFSPQPDIFPQGEDAAEEMAAAMAEPTAEDALLARPAQQPVSRETRHAVHVLRERFSEPGRKTAVRFHGLLPPQTTTKADATKMFFEILVLATKDAVRVKQQQDRAFGQIDVQQKKALWGAWAEEKDEQQVAEDEERQREAAEREEAGRTREVVVGTGRN